MNIVIRLSCTVACLLMLSGCPKDLRQFITNNSGSNLTIMNPNKRLVTWKNGETLRLEDFLIFRGSNSLRDVIRFKKSTQMVDYQFLGLGENILPYLDMEGDSYANDLRFELQGDMQVYLISGESTSKTNQPDGFPLKPQSSREY